MNAAPFLLPEPGIRRYDGLLGAISLTLFMALSIAHDVLVAGFSDVCSAGDVRCVGGIAHAHFYLTTLATRSGRYRKSRPSCERGCGEFGRLWVGYGNLGRRLVVEY